MLTRISSKLTWVIVVAKTSSRWPNMDQFSALAAYMFNGRATNMTITNLGLWQKVIWMLHLIQVDYGAAYSFRSDLQRLVGVWLV